MATPIPSPSQPMIFYQVLRISRLFLCPKHRILATCPNRRRPASDPMRCHSRLGWSAQSLEKRVAHRRPISPFPFCRNLALGLRPGQLCGPHRRRPRRRHHRLPPHHHHLLRPLRGHGRPRRHRGRQAGGQAACGLRLRGARVKNLECLFTLRQPSI